MLASDSVFFTFVLNRRTIIIIISSAGVITSVARGGSSLIPSELPKPFQVLYIVYVCNISSSRKKNARGQHSQRCCPQRETRPQPQLIEHGEHRNSFFQVELVFLMLDSLCPSLRAFVRSSVRSSVRLRSPTEQRAISDTTGYDQRTYNIRTRSRQLTVRHRNSDGGGGSHTVAVWWQMQQAADASRQSATVQLFQPALSLSLSLSLSVSLLRTLGVAGRKDRLQTKER